MNNKVKVGRIFCDLGKAFESVNHNIILLAKVNVDGINGRDYAFYEMYLENIKKNGPI
jgi:hypothetical protein